MTQSNTSHQDQKNTHGTAPAVKSNVNQQNDKKSPSQNSGTHDQDKKNMNKQDQGTGKHSDSKKSY